MRAPGRTAAPLAVLAAGAAVLAACGSDGEAGAPAEGAPGLPRGSEPVSLDPAEFTTKIDNPYWPMAPGSRWVYEEDGGARVVVTVSGETRRIRNGVEALVVSDVVSEDGEPVEVTDDWYAQDAEGNVWYLGEDTAEYENGEVSSRDGSFEAGADGAQPGIAMPANPAPGLAYRQEYYAGEAEDEAEVLSTEEMVTVPFGHFTGALLTKDLVPTEPKVEELKFYAQGVGPVLTLKVAGGSGSERLVSFEPGG